MAELNSSPGKNDGKNVRQPKNIRVDLTAMVDLAFLLVTFFMLTTTLSKSKAMPLAMPDDGPDRGQVSDKRTVTLCLGRNNKVMWYQGLAEKASPAVVDFTKAGLRKVLIENRDKILANTGKDMMVLIKPSDHSIYANLVDAIDELNITNSDRYAIVNISGEDVNLLKEKAIY
jgi:biopolymer transport protein ExbD